MGLHPSDPVYYKDSSPETPYRCVLQYLDECKEEDSFWLPPSLDK